VSLQLSVDMSFNNNNNKKSYSGIYVALCCQHIAEAWTFEVRSRAVALGCTFHYCRVVYACVFFRIGRSTSKSAHFVLQERSR
jgi:hypothetical protein